MALCWVNTEEWPGWGWAVGTNHENIRQISVRGELLFQSELCKQEQGWISLTSMLPASQFFQTWSSIRTVTKQTVPVYCCDILQQLVSSHHSSLAQLVPVSCSVQNGILSPTDSQQTWAVLGELVLLQPHLIYQSSGHALGGLSTLFCKDFFIF